MTLFSRQASALGKAGGQSVLSRQVRWQHPKIVQGGIDQTRLAIADAPTAPMPFSFLVMGDTDVGSLDSLVEGSNFSTAFSQQLLQKLGESRFLLHTGDVTYPIGSYKNYLLGFLTPYQALLSSIPKALPYQASSVIFKRPLFPVLGNHDYATIQGSAQLWQRLLRFICDQLRTLGVDFGHYGGQGGEAYGKAFLDDLATLKPEQLTDYLATHYSAPANSALVNVFPDSTAQRCLNYQPGQFTRLPNRYYTFRYGGVDFFALDSNTWNRKPESEGFDHEQLEWLRETLTKSWRTPNTVGRIVFFHHAPYTTEETRWQSSETLWVRRNFRTVLDGVAAALDQGKRAPANNGPFARNSSLREQQPLVDLVISGHAHCLEHVKTTDTGHADACTDWVVCGGSGAGLRRQRKADTADILENISLNGRSYTKAVAKSQLYAGIHGSGAKKQRFHSFLRIDVRPQLLQPFRVLPFVVVRGREGWQTKALSSLAIGDQARCVVAG